LGDRRLKGERANSRKTWERKGPGIVEEKASRNERILFWVIFIVRDTGN